MAHTCHATNCEQPIPPRMFMCQRHWFALPKRLRDAIWQHYRPGQEVDKRPSHAYCMTAIECIRFCAEYDGVEPDVTLYEMFDPGADE